VNDQKLIADLVRAGLNDDLVNRVATALLNVRDSPGHVRDIVRAYETGRKRKQRENVDKSGGKQTMSARSSVPQSSEIVRDNFERGCQLTSFLSSSATPSTEVQRSKEEKSSRRGTRLQAGATISEVDCQFARDSGHNDMQIGKMWAEFIDYWISVPGSRGTKLNWSATWRNRVRQLSGGKGYRNGKGNAVMEAFDHAIDRAGGSEIGGDYPMVDVTPRRS
jgi:hypothetical protein